MKYVNDTCCRPTITTCKEMGAKTEHRECKVQLGEVVCEKPKGDGKIIQTCSQLKDYTRKKGEIQKIQQVIDFQADEDYSSEEYVTYEEEDKVSVEEEDKDSVKEEEEKVKLESFEAFQHKQRVTTATTTTTSMKIKNELSKKEMMKIVRDIDAHKAKIKTNPKCRNSLSR